MAVDDQPEISLWPSREVAQAASGAAGRAIRLDFALHLVLSNAFHKITR